MSNPSNPENPSTNPEPERRELAVHGAPQGDSASAGQEETVEPYISTQLQLRAKVEYLGGLSLTGLVPVARINAAHSCFRTALQYSENPSSFDASMADEDALRILRENPELLKVLQPLLTPDQLAMIIRESPNE